MDGLVTRTVWFYENLIAQRSTEEEENSVSLVNILCVGLAAEVLNLFSNPENTVPVLDSEDPENTVPVLDPEDALPIFDSDNYFPILDWITGDSTTATECLA